MTSEKATMLCDECVERLGLQDLEIHDENGYQARMIRQLVDDLAKAFVKAKRSNEIDKTLDKQVTSNTQAYCDVKG